VLLHHQFNAVSLNCAWVGGNFKTSLGIVIFAENLTMSAMGVVMLGGS
jgi:hypothetical protein